MHIQLSFSLLDAAFAVRVVVGEDKYSTSFIEQSESGDLAWSGSIHTYMGSVTDWPCLLWWSCM